MKDQKSIVSRLKRIEGQLRGIQKMVEEGRDCRKVLQQIAASRSALAKAGLVYLNSHLETCLKSKKKMGEETLDQLRKLTESISMIV